MSSFFFFNLLLFKLYLFLPLFLNGLQPSFFLFSFFFQEFKAFSVFDQGLFLLEPLFMLFQFGLGHFSHNLCLFCLSLLIFLYSGCFSYNFLRCLYLLCGQFLLKLLLPLFFLHFNSFHLLLFEHGCNSSLFLLLLRQYLFLLFFGNLLIDWEFIFTFLFFSWGRSLHW